MVPRLALAWFCVPLALSAMPVAQTKLNAPLARAVGRLGELAVTPDGARVVYAAEEQQYGALELFSAPADGSAPAVKVSGPYTGGEPTRWYLAPDSQRVVYALDGVGRLMSAPLDGSAPPVQLADIGCAGCDDSDFALTFSADGAFVLFRDERYDHHPLYTVPLDGHAPAVVLGGEQPWRTPGFPPVADGVRVAFHDYEPGGSTTRLFARPIDASAPAVRLDVGLSSTGDPLALAPNGEVLFLARNEMSPSNVGLYAVPLDASAAPRALAQPTIAGGDVLAFALTSAGTQVVFTGDAEIDGQNELFVVPLDASQAPRRLNHTLTSGSNVIAHALSPDGTRVVYRAFENGVAQLWSARLDVRRRAVRLNGALVAGGNVGGFAITPDSASVLFSGDGRIDGHTELFRVPIDGSEQRHALAVDRPRVERLSGALPAAGLLAWRLAPGGEFVLFLVDRDGNGVRELESLPLAGGPPLRLDQDPGPGGSKSWELAAANGRALYVLRADYRADEALLSVPFTGGAATRLNGALAHGPTRGRVIDYVVTPDGAAVVYQADQEYVDSCDLHIVPSDGSRAPLSLSTSGGFSANVPLPEGSTDEDARSFRLTPGAEALVYLADPDLDRQYELFRAPLDGSAPPTALGSGERVLHGFRLDPAGTEVVFLRSDDVATLQLYRVPLDGSAPPTRLSGSLAQGGNVVDFALAPDGARVVFRADAEVDDRFELWSVPLAGGARVRLSPALASGRSVSRFLVTADSTTVLFLADARIDEQYELYATPLAGGTPRELDPALTGSGHVLTFVPTPDATRVVFVARSDAQKLWSVPLEGATAPVRLDGPTIAGGQVLDQDGLLLVAPASDRALYVADQEVRYRYELWSVPLDGSLPAVRRSRADGDGVRASRRGDLALARDGRHVFYFENPPTSLPELARTTVAGPLAPLLFGEPDIGWSSFVLSPTGLELLFLATPTPFEGPQLHWMPSDASRPARRIDLAPGPCTGAWRAGFSRDGRRAFWLDEAQCGVFELWSLRLPQHVRANDERP